jgi:biopolymer transport protein ExbD
MRIPSHQRNRQVGIDQAMTPMIDCVFLLLIFFVCASVGRIAESLMSVDLSSGRVEATDATPVETKPAWVTDVWLKLKWDDATNRTVVEMNGRDFREFEPLKTDLLTLAELSPDSPIILDIEPRVPAGDLIRVDDTCRAAGFRSISYATDPQKLNTKQR